MPALQETIQNDPRTVPFRPGARPVPATPSPSATSISPQPPAPIQRQQLGDWSEVEKMRANHFANLPLEKKLDAVLTQAGTAEKIAYEAMRGVEAFDRKLDGILDQIKQLASGKPKETPPPNTSIWDDDTDTAL